MNETRQKKIKEVNISKGEHTLSIAFYDDVIKIVQLRDGSITDTYSGVLSDLLGVLLGGRGLLLGFILSHRRPLCAGMAPSP